MQTAAHEIKRKWWMIAAIENIENVFTILMFIKFNAFYINDTLLAIMKFLELGFLVNQIFMSLSFIHLIQYSAILFLL